MKKQQDQIKNTIDPNSTVLRAPPINHPLPSTAERIDLAKKAQLDQALEQNIEPGAGMLFAILDNFREQLAAEELNQANDAKVQLKATIAQTKLNFNPSKADLKFNLGMKKSQPE